MTLALVETTAWPGGCPRYSIMMLNSTGSYMRISTMTTKDIKIESGRAFTIKRTN
jgi:hypothetical protein